MMSKHLQRILIGVLASYLLGCGSPQHLQPEDIRPLPYSTGRSTTTRIDGLRQDLRESPKAPVRLLMVHGMITNTVGYSKAMQQAIADRLGLVPGNDSDPFLLDRGYDILVFSGPQPFSQKVGLKQSSLRKTSWVDPSQPSIERLVFYELLWAPLRDQVKNKYLACFESRSIEPGTDCTPFTDAKPNEDSRDLINGLIKDGLLIKGLADATIVLGKIGDVLRDDVNLAMCYVASDVFALDGPRINSEKSSRCSLSNVPKGQSVSNFSLKLSGTKFHAITESLGSFLVMDAQKNLAELRGRDQAITQSDLLNYYLFDQSRVFMMANQVSLLQLGRLTAACIPRDGGSTCPNRNLSTLQQITDQPAPSPQMTKYIAFNDVNDVLGFELPPYLPDTGLYGDLANVSVQNPGWSIPMILKNPYAAHTQQAANAAIVEALVEGFEYPAAYLNKKK